MNVSERDLLMNGARKLGIELNETDIDRFSILSEELIRWNSKVNLTALKRVADIIAKHFLDSLTLLPLLPFGASLLDIGSGGGFPSLPLKIVRQDLDMVSVDSVQKKILFQRHVARMLELDKFVPIHARAEELAASLDQRFDFVAARAVADLPSLVRLGMPLLAGKGRLIAMKGGLGREEVAQAESELSHLDVVVEEIREFRLPNSGDVRMLITLKRHQG